MRHIALVGLMLAMVLTAITVGHARGQAPVAGQMVLCVGTQIVTVSVDADGQPVTVTHACPDGIMALAGPLVPPVALVVPGAVGQSLIYPVGRLSVPSLRLIEDRARAPPRGA
jgi:hypothetical protein